MIPLPRTQLLNVVRVLTLASLAAAVPAAAQDVAAVGENASYSYVRTIEGRATLASEGRGPGEEADLNQPVLQGDTVRVAGGARVEVALADRNLLRVGGDTTVTLARVAFSADRNDRTTRLDLDEGEILLLVGEDALGDELPEIRTSAGTIFVHEPGEYRVTFDHSAGLELLVRAGYAELLTERGSTVVRGGEEAWTRGDGYSRVEVAEAGPYDALERWGDELERDAYAAEERTIYVEPEYRYAAAPLTQYGSWVFVDSTWAWRPRVTADWRPYWNGRWAWTPSGMTWVSAEPWGWLPYHYGTWYQAAGYGWCWRPGRVYAPAWVYWHVGPQWTGWCPVGYYTSFYRNHWSNGFRFGVYGWAGGSWSAYADWNFCPTGRVYDRYDRGYRHTGAHVGRLAGTRAPHGVLTTDTRGLDHGDWGHGDLLVAKLGRRAGATPDRLTEVTDFVARKRTLTPEVEHAVVAQRRGGRRTGTPLDPQPEMGGRGEPDSTPAPGWRSKRSSDGGETRVVGRGRPEGDTPGIEIGRGGFGDGRGESASGQRRGEPAPRIVTRPGGDVERERVSGGSRPIEIERPGFRSGGGNEEYGRGRGAPPVEVARDDRQGWQQGTPYGGGGASRPAPEPATAVDGRGRSESQRYERPERYGYGAPESDSRSSARRVERPDESPVTRVIGGVRRGVPEADERSRGNGGYGSPRPVERPSYRETPQVEDRGVPQPSYRGTPQPSYRGTPQPSYRGTPQPAYPSAPPTARQPESRGSSGTVQQRPASSPQVSSPPSSRDDSSSRSSSTSSSRSSGNSSNGGNTGRSESSPPKRGGGNGRHGGR